MQELMCFSVFLYQYIESLMFLKVARRGGGYSPPPKSATGSIMVHAVPLVYVHTYIMYQDESYNQYFEMT